MTNFFRITVCSCLFAMLSPAGLPLHAQPRQIGKIKASALKVEMIQSDQISLPAAFQAAIYENLIQQLGKRASFLRVYRDGDRDAASIPDLVVLRTTVSEFKKGSEEMRQVTTVAGATSITIHCRFIDPKGKVLLEKDVSGKVRFFGDNLKATYDFAKKASAAVSGNFTATGQS
jgi:hypothetical protein